MRQEEWIEEQWDGNLVAGLAQRINPDSSSITRYEAAPGRAELEAAIDELVETLGGEIEYTESIDGASDAHLTIGRVHLKLRRSAWNLVEHAAALAVALVLLNPGGIVHGIRLVQTLIGAATILSLAERNALAVIMDNQRRGIATARKDVARFGVDVDGLVANGVLVEREHSLSISA